MMKIKHYFRNYLISIILSCKKNKQTWLYIKGVILDLSPTQIVIDFKAYCPQRIITVGLMLKERFMMS